MSLHLFARALTEYFKVNKWRATICCDNQKALECLAHHLQRIKPSSKCANIRQSFRDTKQGLSGIFKYEHVYGHMDNYLLWHQLTIKKQLNCVCNTLAKRAIKTAIRQGYQDTPTQILLREDVALVIKGNKITDDISQPLRFHAGRETARQHLTIQNRKPWTKECFDKIDWHHLDLAKKNKADMFKIWRSNQSSEFCRTRVQVC
jgi:hypothetical protein